MDSAPARDEAVADGLDESPDEGEPMDRDTSLEALQQQLGYHFAHLDILCRALTHRSYLQDGPGGGESSLPSSALDGRPPDRIGHNERLEFLGDAVLGLAISDWLFRRFPDQPEGALSHWRSALVNTQSLARISHTHQLGRFLHMGRGELLSGGRGKTSLLGNAVEALLGAIYLDGGYTAACEVVQRLFAEVLSDCRPGQWDKDYKSMLQERLQGAGLPLPDYQVITIDGLPHERVFQIACVVDRGMGEPDPFSCIGFGRSKRNAEQAAAKAVYAALYRHETEGQHETNGQHETDGRTSPLNGQEREPADASTSGTEKEANHA